MIYIIICEPYGGIIILSRRHRGLVTYTIWVKVKLLKPLVQFYWHQIMQILPYSSWTTQKNLQIRRLFIFETFKTHSCKYMINGKIHKVALNSHSAKQFNGWVNNHPPWIHLHTTSLYGPNFSFNTYNKYKLIKLNSIWFDTQTHASPTVYVLYLFTAVTICMYMSFVSIEQRRYVCN